MTEEFKPVPVQPFGERYSISNLGRVRVNHVSRYSRTRTRFLKPGIGARGYPCVTLYLHGNHKQVFIHRLVAIAFNGPQPSDKPLVRHLNDDRTDNRASNLCWGTHSENMRDMVNHGRSLTGTRNPRAILSPKDAVEIRHLYATTKISQREIAERYGVVQTQISRVVRGQVW